MLKNHSVRLTVVLKNMEAHRCAKCTDSKHTFRLARQSYTLLAYIKRQFNNLHPLPFLKIATTNAQVAIANLSTTLIGLR